MTPRHLILALALIPAATLPMPAFAQASAGQPALSADREAAGVALARMILPDDNIAHVAFDAMLDGIQRSDGFADEQTAYAAHPGMREFIWTPLRADMLAAVRAEIPGFQQEAGRAIAAAVPLDDMQSIIAFLRTPVGRRLIIGVYATFENGRPSTAEQNAARQKFLASMTPAETAEADRFAHTRAAAQWSQVMAQLVATQKVWIARILPPLIQTFRASYVRRRAEFLATKREPSQ